MPPARSPWPRAGSLRGSFLREQESREAHPLSTPALAGSTSVNNVGGTPPFVISAKTGVHAIPYFLDSRSPPGACGNGLRREDVSQSSVEVQFMTCISVIMYSVALRKLAKVRPLVFYVKKNIACGFPRVRKGCTNRTLALACTLFRPAVPLPASAAVGMGGGKMYRNDTEDELRGSK